MPVGLLVTDPEPVPVRDTLRVFPPPPPPPPAVNVAVTARAASIVTWQVVAVPEQAPDQDVKVDPFPGWAVNVTVVPSG
jgi:hypothetical protein